LLLLRHARAGKREEWPGDDRLRPLDERGRRQAAALVDALSGFALTRILSSPYRRCVQTVEPLASARGLPIEEREELSEECQHAALGFLRSFDGEPVVLCTHGGVDELVGNEFGYKKGSTLVLGDGLKPERYLPPPA
jgi:phosphohistidine phosphatase SixA